MESSFNREDAFKDLVEIKQVFDSCGVPFFVAYGTCLGFVREKNFIKHDDDMDISVTAKIDFETRKKIGWMLFDLGFDPQPISFNVCGRMEPSIVGYNGDGETGIIVCHKRVDTSIFFFKEEDCEKHGREYVCTPKLGSLKLIASPIKFYEKPDWIKIKGVKFPVPSPVKDYLKYTYGEWKKPIPGKAGHALQFNEMHKNDTK